jgi:hypothetical protein
VVGRIGIGTSRRSNRTRKSGARDEDVFINVPFDLAYRDMYVALVAGLVGLGFRPRGVLEVPPNKDRLDRLREIIDDCSSSVHDLSRVELSDGYPRFNMPFELGLCARSSNDFFLFESERYRLQRTLSDLNGRDPLIHSGKPRPLLARLRDAYGIRGRRPPLDKLWTLFGLVMEVAEELETEQCSLFGRTAFEELVVAAQYQAKKMGLG